MAIPRTIQELSDAFASLPGVGSKLSNRLALYLTVNNKSLAHKLSKSINEALDKIQLCENCFNISEDHLCDICQDEKRDASTFMIVETPLDLYSIEDSGEYKGLYHVLNGVISPVNGIGPDDLTIDALKKRIKETKVEEVIFALNTNLEGESTTLYVKDEIENLGLDVKVTRLAKGIPVGSSIEYLSHQTISDSILRRSDFD